MALLGYIVTPEVVEYEFTKVDKNGDGKISFREFRKLMNEKLTKEFFKID